MTNGIAPVGSSDGIGFGEWLARVITRWRVIAWSVGVIVALALAMSLLSPPIYRGQATFLAASGTGSRIQSLAGAMGVSGIASQLGLGASSDPGASPQFYQQLVASRELLTRLATASYPDPRHPGTRATATMIDLIGPKQLPDQRKTLEMTLRSLSKLVRASPDPKTNVITVTADVEWPELAATLVNRTTALVDSFNVEQRQSRARSRRVFAESRVQAAQGTLRAAEEQLRDFHATNRQWQQSPELTFEEARLRRQEEIESELYLTLRRELEMSRLDEINDIPVITVVDSAVVPAIRQWPKRTAIMVASVFVGLFVGVLIAGAQVLIADWRERNPDQAADLDTAFRGIPIAGRLAGRRPAALDTIR